MANTYWKNMVTEADDIRVIVTGDDVNGTIVALGNENLLLQKRAGDRVEDLEGGFVTPGFWDSHFHLLDYGRSFRRLNFRAADTRQAILDQVRQETRRRAPGEWIFGGGWNKESFDAPPSLRDLDAVTSSHPVLLMSLDYHTAWINSLALSLFKINVNAEERAEHDHRGRFTGILRETLAFWAQEEAMKHERHHLREDLARGMREANRLGLVGVTSMENGVAFRGLQELRDGQRTLRVGVFLRDQHLPSLIDLGLTAGFGNSWVRLLGIKIFVDGALGSQTAWMKKPYEGSLAHRGIGLVSSEAIRDRVKAAHTAGLAVAIHAIGDMAVHVVADALNRESGGHEVGIRDRIEHAQLIEAEDLTRIRESGVGVSMQPVHLLVDRPIADHYWGARSAHAFPFRNLWEQSVPLLFGSDAPVADPNPALGLWASVNRAEGDEAPWYPEQGLSPDAAIKAYTAVPAWCDNRRSGQIAPGFWGDMTVWHKDPRPELIHKSFPALSVMATVAGGRRVY